MVMVGWAAAVALGTAGLSCVADGAVLDGFLGLFSLPCGLCRLFRCCGWLLG